MDQEASTLKQQLFTKVVTSHFDSEHGCLVPEGELLLLGPRPRRQVRHGSRRLFIGAKHADRTCRIGWVTPWPACSLDQLLASANWNTAAAGPLEDQELLFRSIADMAEGTPVAASYFHRVFPTNEITLRVHRVVLLGR